MYGKGMRSMCILAAVGSPLAACSNGASDQSFSRGSGSMGTPSPSPAPVDIPPPPPTESPPKPTERWQPFTQTDKMDDSHVVGVKVIADEDVKTMYGRMYRPRFWIGCQKNTTQAYFDVGTVLSTETRAWESDSAYGYTNGTPLRLRLDKDKPLSNFGNTSTDGSSAFLTNPIPILKKMIGRTTLLVEYTPMAGAPQTATFTITGMEEAIVDLRKACRW